MTLFTLAVKQVRHRFRSYAAYFLSGAFATWLFFVYQTLLTHPGLAPLLDLDANFRTILGIVSGVIGVFSALFILYAHSAFLKVRQRELGLLAVIGLTNRQIVRTILMETMLLGMGAVTMGVTVGILGQSLMVNLVGLTLRLIAPLPPFMPWAALRTTYLVFGGIFIVVSLLSHVTLWRTPLVKSLTSNRRPVPSLRHSPWLALVAVGLLGWVYWFIWNLDARFDHILCLIIAGLVGSYLLFSQALSYGLSVAARIPRLHLRGLNLLGVSQLRARLSENVMVLFMVSTLTAVVLFLMGTALTAQSTAMTFAERIAPIPIQVVGQEHGVTASLVHEALAATGIALTREVHEPILKGHYGPLVQTPTGQVDFVGQLRGYIISQSSLSRWLAAGGRSLPLELPGVPENAALVPWETNDSHYAFTLGSGARLELNPVKAAELSDSRLVNLGSLGQVVVVSDKTFANWQSLHPDQVVTLSGYYTAGHPVDLLPVFDYIAERVGDHFLIERLHVSDITATALTFEEQRRTAGQMLFVFGFLGVLFFLAACQMLFFRLFTHLREDQEQYAALSRLGLSETHVARLVSVQSLVLFFLPPLVGVVNGGLLMRTVNVSEGISNYAPFFWVVGGYATLQLLYYLASRRVYVRAVLPRA